MFSLTHQSWQVPIMSVTSQEHLTSFCLIDRLWLDANHHEKPWKCLHGKLFFLDTTVTLFLARNPRFLLVKLIDRCLWRHSGLWRHFCLIDRWAGDVRVAVNHLTGRNFLKDRSMLWLAQKVIFVKTLILPWIFVGLTLPKHGQIRAGMFSACLHTKFAYHGLNDLHSGLKKVRKKRFLFNSPTMFVCCL